MKSAIETIGFLTLYFFAILVVLEVAYCVKKGIKRKCNK